MELNVTWPTCGLNVCQHCHILQLQQLEYMYVCNCSMHMLNLSIDNEVMHNHLYKHCKQQNYLINT